MWDVSDFDPEELDAIRTLLDPELVEDFRTETRQRIDMGLPTPGFGLEENPLWTLIELTDGARYIPGTNLTPRDRAAQLYAWAVPNKEALSACMAFGPLVEMGAGNGYWAALIEASGYRKINAYDGFTKQFGFRKDATWTTVFSGGPEKLKQYSPDWTLLLVWPPYDDPFGTDCLLTYQGDWVIYVGESGGCTGDKMFEFILKHAWERANYISIPNWEGIHDTLRIYKRHIPIDEMVDYINEKLDAVPEDERFLDYPGYRLV